jgi:chemotaxis protein histidine kinase CheA
MSGYSSSRTHPLKDSQQLSIYEGAEAKRNNEQRLEDANKIARQNEKERNKRAMENFQQRQAARRDQRKQHKVAEENAHQPRGGPSSSKNPRTPTEKQIKAAEPPPAPLARAVAGVRGASPRVALDFSSSDARTSVEAVNSQQPKQQLHKRPPPEQQQQQQPQQPQQPQQQQQPPQPQQPPQTQQQQQQPPQKQQHQPQQPQQPQQHHQHPQQQQQQQQQQWCTQQRCTSCDSKPFCVQVHASDPQTSLTQSNFNEGVPPKRQKGRTKGGYAGLYNLGATCYVNVILQMMFFNLLLREAVNNLDVAASEGSSDCKVVGARPIVDALVLTFQRLLVTPHSEYNPRRFVTACGLNQNMQETAAEFFQLVVDHALNWFPTKQGSDVAHPDDLVGIRIDQQLACPSCPWRGTRRRRATFALYLGIGFDTTGNDLGERLGSIVDERLQVGLLTRLDACRRRLTPLTVTSTVQEARTLEEGWTHKCPLCGCVANRVTDTSPDVRFNATLFIDVGRAAENGADTETDKTSVYFPQQFPTKSNGGDVWVAIGFVYHNGTHAGGHYSGEYFDFVTGKWYLCDDGTVTGSKNPGGPPPGSGRGAARGARAGNNLYRPEDVQLVEYMRETEYDALLGKGKKTPTTVKSADEFNDEVRTEEAKSDAVVASRKQAVQDLLEDLRASVGNNGVRYVSTTWLQAWAKVGWLSTGVEDLQRLLCKQHGRIDPSLVTGADYKAIPAGVVDQILKVHNTTLDGKKGVQDFAADQICNDPTCRQGTPVHVNVLQFDGRTDEIGAAVENARAAKQYESQADLQLPITCAKDLTAAVSWWLGQHQNFRDFRARGHYLGHEGVPEEVTDVNIGKLRDEGLDLVVVVTPASASFPHSVLTQLGEAPARFLSPTGASASGRAAASVPVPVRAPAPAPAPAAPAPAAAALPPAAAALPPAADTSTSTNDEGSHVPPDDRTTVRMYNVPASETKVFKERFAGRFHYPPPHAPFSFFVLPTAPSSTCLRGSAATAS